MSRPSDTIAREIIATPLINDAGLSLQDILDAEQQHNVAHLIGRELESVAAETIRLLNSADARHDARVTELLQHNNELLERARKAERLVEDLKVSLKGCATVVGMMARMEDPK